MINKIIEFSVKKPYQILLLFLVLTVFGFYLIDKNKFDAIPDLSDKQVIVEISSQGNSPKTIEEQITYPLTQSLLSIPKTKTVRGFSFINKSYIYIIFEDSVDLYWARSRVLEYLNSAKSDLPSNVSYEIGSDASGVGWIYQYALTDKTNTYNISDLTTFQDWTIKQKLESVSGVSEIATVGGYKKEYEVIISPNKMLSYELEPKDIEAAIRKNNSEVGGSILEQGEKEFLIQSDGLLRNINDIKNIIIKYNPKTQENILLKDISHIREGAEPRRGIAELNGQGEVVGGIVVMRYNANPLKTIEGIKKKIKEIKNSLPKEIEFVTVYDRSKLINNSIDNLKNKITEEIIIVSLICLLLFFSIRSSLAIIISIPISVIISFIVTYYLDLTLNIMSLGGIAISIGVIVDAAIVMVDNVNRKINTKNTKETFIKACQEVAPSLFFSLLIISISFLPLLLLTGQESKMFEPLVLTKTIIMFLSTIIAITFIPAIIAIFVKKPALKEEKHYFFIPIIFIYKKIINFLLKFKKTTITISILLILSVTYPINKMTYEFIPELNEGDLLYMPTTLPSISPTEAQKILQITDKLIKQVPEVKTVFGKVGKAETSTDPAPLTMFETTIQLKDKIEWRKGFTLQDIIRDLDQKVQIPSLRNAWIQPIKTRIDMLSTGVKSPIALKISGTKFDDITKLAKNIENKIKNIDNVQSVFAERLSEGSYLKINPKRDKLNKEGINITDFQQYVKYAVGGQQVDTIYQGRERYGISLRYPREYRDNIQKIKDMYISINNKNYSLSEIADINIENYPTMIKTENSELVSYIYIYLKNNDFESFIKKANKEIENINFNGNYIEWIGDYKKLKESEETFSFIIPLVVLVILFIVFSLYQSIYLTTVNFLSIIFSISGSIWLLSFFGFNFSIATYVGLLALAGLSIELSILMTTYILNEKGNKKNRLINGAVKRIRPKFITALTVIFSLLPIMLSEGAGNEFLITIVAPLFFGIIFSFLYSLIFLPIFISYYLKD
tara:strand:+ start:60030 stop:63071 length:3042 start_codon:yes stop_codon:yes gene_type:complete